MYQPNHGQHIFMNGGTGFSRHNVHVGLGKPFQQQGQQHQNHNTSHAQHDHATHNPHAANYGNHQHTLSGGLTSQYQQHQAQNGTPQSAHSSLINTANEHYNLQRQAYQNAMESRATHHHARNTVAAKNAVLANASNGAKKENDQAERLRPTHKEQAHQAWNVIDLGGQGLKAISPALFQYTFLDKLYFNYNKLPRLPPSIGSLRHLTYLDLSFNNISEIPSEIGMLTELRILLLFDNPIHDLPLEVGLLPKLELLGVEGCPLEPTLKDMICEHGTAHLVQYLRERCIGPEAPMDRPWVTVDESPETRDSQSKFTVLSNNILCDAMANPNLYGWVPLSALKWEHRRELIIEELRARQPDIICLQECNAEAYNDDFRPVLAHDDYRGVFYARGRASLMGEREARIVDGCATFYKNSRYLMLDKQFIYLSNVAINRPDMKGEHDVFNRVMNKDHIATVVFLEERATGVRLIVANTHLFWDPHFVDVKIVQGAIMMEQLTKLAEKYAKWPASTAEQKSIYKYASGDSDDADGVEKAVPQVAPSKEYASGSQIPMLICGDYNSEPGSPVHQLITKGSLPSSHPDLQGRSYGSFTRDGISHPLNIKSSYSAIGELNWTNYTPSYQEPIDYIFYSTNSLQVTGLLGEVDKEYLQRVPGFPNHHFPSDHLALMVEYHIKGEKKG
ncbi:MAG: Glucose-repressible alcohol dehydrogenase transcriptional effector [Bogoriella megaspora]|nr:MAG: Glucose-repressible alcohol dehydrogenase transcriptional effector [Bogoriella megaspora]